MKTATIKLDGKAAGTLRVCCDGYELTGGRKGYQYFREWVDQLSQKTLRRHALMYASMYLTGQWHSERVTMGRLVDKPIK